MNRKGWGYDVNIDIIAYYKHYKEYIVGNIYQGYYLLYRLWTWGR